MTNETLIKDLEYATDIARRAEQTPLIGGPIGLMWTSLATIALMAHGAILAGWVGVGPAMAGLVWLVYGIVGTVLSVILGRRFTRTPGSSSLANRVAEASWMSMGLLITVVAVTTVAAFMSGRVELLAFNFIVPIAFALSAASYGTLAKLTGYGYLTFAAVASALSASVTLFIVTEPSMYFVAGILLILSGVIPSVIELRKAGA
jgi:hypothetical protein